MGMLILYMRSGAPIQIQVAWGEDERSAFFESVTTTVGWLTVVDSANTKIVVDGSEVVGVGYSKLEPQVPQASIADYEFDRLRPIS